MRNIIAADYYKLGTSYYEKGELDLALKAYTKAIELNPKHIAAHNNRGCVYERMQEYDKAMADFTKAIEIDPKDVDAYNCRGCIYQAQGKFDLAIKDYERAFEINQYNFWTLYNLNQIFLVIKHGDLDGIDKRTVFSAIKMLPDEDQIPLLEKCLNQDNPLGNRLWKKEGINECSRESGTLKEIREYLGELYVKRGRIKIGNGIFRKCRPPQRDELEVPESAIGMHNRL